MFNKLKNNRNQRLCKNTNTYNNICNVLIKIMILALYIYIYIRNRLVQTVRKIPNNRIWC